MNFEEEWGRKARKCVILRAERKDSSFLIPPF